jgi:hypothetical protein
MMQITESVNGKWFQRTTLWTVAIIWAAMLCPMSGSAAEQNLLNLLKNPGFEVPASAPDNPPNWAATTDGAGKVLITNNVAHGGLNAIAIPAHTAIEQKLDSVVSGPYLARCWVKSEAEQPITFFLRDADRPWAAYNCAEFKVPRGQWIQLEIFCALDRSGSLTLTLGGTSKDFRNYHGTEGEMGSPIIADDFELIRYEPKTSSDVASLAATAWDGKSAPGPDIDWSTKDLGALVKSSAQAIAGPRVAGVVRQSDGGLAIYAVQDGKLKQRCVVTPSPAIASPKCSVVSEKERTGIRVSSATGDRSYVAWFTTKGLVTIEATQVPQFQVRDCHLRYGLLPSFAGTDICYAPQKMSADSEFRIPSTQWFVGLVDGNESMLVAAWKSDAQAVSLGLSGAGENRMIDSLSIATDKSGFSLSLVEHAGIWHRESLNEDWLGEYVPIAWERPFPAHWMGHFFVTPGGEASFRNPYMDYSFPIASAKTRMWGVWFEDWNHYPFFFDGQRTIFHFEKTFVPNGEALIYFLEPAAADLFSPCEIVAQALGQDKADALFDFDANKLRKLKYSTPDQFLFDRPVCATTTRLSKIKNNEKPTLGVDLATHLFEFIREIRGRVDQYGTFFTQMKDYLASEKKAHPELKDYIAELEGMISAAQAQSEEIYATPLPSVEKKIDAMRKLLKEGKGDGFDCGNLDVRGTAGSQDDICRRYNRVVMRLSQTAALKCGDSPQKAVIAKYIWDQSRAVLRQPTRWESRRTLFFFEL